MPKLSYLGGDFDCEAGETVLNALVRQGAPVNFSCRKGSCLACVLVGPPGDIPATAQAGLRAALRDRGGFLACQLRPVADLSVEPPGSAVPFGRAVLRSVERLTPAIARIRLETETPLEYHAGQFINLRRADGLTRSYSLASVPRLDPFLEIHVRASRNGRMSPWLVDGAAPGDEVEIEGPHGECHYLQGRPDEPLLLIGTGTGLAPLIGVARDALGGGHAGGIFLFHGSGTAADHYLHDQLLGMAGRHANFHYAPCCSQPAASSPGGHAGSREGRADDIAFSDHPDLSGWRIYLCGNPDMVRLAKRRAYLAGARLADIHADPFDLQDLRASLR